MPHSRRKVLQTFAFHVSIVDQMKAIRPSSTDGRGRAVQCARMVRTTACPGERNLVRTALEELFKRFKLCEEKDDFLNTLSAADISQFNGAFEALDIQDNAESRPKVVDSKAWSGVTG